MIVQEWTKSSTSHQTLVFSKAFTKGQRAVMHKTLLSLGLRGKSYGEGEDRHLTVSKFSWDQKQELSKEGVSDVLELLQREGETEKYKLIAPA